MNTSTIEDIGKADGLVHSDDKHEVEMLEHEHKPSDAAATAGIDARSGTHRIRGFDPVSNLDEVQEDQLDMLCRHFFGLCRGIRGT
jgi:hypothetical protein